MKRFPWRWVLSIAGLLLLLGLGGVAWLLGTRTGARQVERWVRQRLTSNSELVLGPLEVELTPWRDFPHLTASLHHLQLTDTTAGRAVPVLRIGRADLRVELADLLHGRVRVTRLGVSDVAITEYVDSTGRRWGLHPKKRKAGKSPLLGLTLDSIVVENFRIATRNDYIHSALSAQVGRASLAARSRRGVLHVVGTVGGQLDSLRGPSGTWFRHEPVRAWVRYDFNFKQKEGTFADTRFTLNGDTVHLNGTLRVPIDRPTGTLLNLQFAGSQPLLAVFNTVLPPRLRPYLAGASSSSKAQISYHIAGISGPTDRPRTVLQFALRNGQVSFPDSTRRITRWDVRGTFDNGPEHRPQTNTLTLQQCRIYTSAGRLDVGLLLRNFKRPFLNANIRGISSLPELAAATAPELWRGRAGQATLDLHLRGELPARGPKLMMRAASRQGMTVRGTVALRNASFVMLRRGADVRHLNVNLGLNDSLWHFANASGELAGMRFRASARTTYLLAYLSAQHPSTSISGQFAVDELYPNRLRQLLRPIPPGEGAVARPRRAPRTAAQMAATLGGGIIPPGVRLDVGLHCGRLVLADDTLRDLAVHVRHDGRQMQLTHLSGRLWGGQVRGQASWPTATASKVVPVNFQLDVHFGTVSYQHLLSQIRPMQPAAPRPRPAGRPADGAAALALRDLLLAANGYLNCTINTVQLPDHEELRHLRLRLVKDNDALRLPYLRFSTGRGGTGEVAAAARLVGLHLTDADATVNLYYPTLDVRELLRLLVVLTPPRRPPTVAQLAARSSRRAKRSTVSHGTLLSNGKLVALLRVQADEVRYDALQGHKFRLVSRLDDGEARLDDCSLEAFGGNIRLRGRLLTPDETPDQHTLRTQLQLTSIQLPELFAATSGMGLKVLGSNNVRGIMNCTADLNSVFGQSFAPALDRTTGYLRANIRELELLNVEALEQGLSFMKKERTSHLFFEPVKADFILSQGELLIPDLRLDSNLSQLAVSGTYGLDGRANLYLGLKPFQALFGNNDKRVGRIINDQPVNRNEGKLTYLNLRRTDPNGKYAVRLFKKNEQREQQAELRQRAAEVMRLQQQDTTVQLLR